MKKYLIKDLSLIDKREEELPLSLSFFEVIKVIAPRLHIPPLKKKVITENIQGVGGSSL